MHPRLLTSLILLDPVVQRYPNAEGNYGPARASVNRRDVWSSREEAGTKLMRSKFYQAWDPRVLDKWLKYGLRDLPTRLHPEVPTSSVFPSPSVGSESSIARPAEHDGPITLTTTKHQEVLTFGRANIPTEEYPDPAHRPNPDTHPDVDSSAQPNAPFYAPVPIATFGRLPNLRPSVFYVFGSESNLSAPVLKADKLANTGVGVGGSGGVQAGRVADVTFEGVGHLIPMEVVGRTAEVCADWLEPELKRWNQLETTAQKAWAAVPIEEKSKFGHQYEDALKDYWDKEVVARKQDTKL